MSDQTYTNPSLMYESLPPDRPSGMRTAAWISLLVVGILYALGGLCAAGGTMMFGAVMQQAMAARGAGGGGGGAPANLSMIMVIVGLAILLLMGAVATVYIWSAFRVRRGSRGAMVTSLVVAGVNSLGIMGLVCLGLFGLLAGRRGADPQAALGLLVYLVPAAANVWLVIALAMVLRERRV